MRSDGLDASDEGVGCVLGESIHRIDSEATAASASASARVDRDDAMAKIEIRCRKCIANLHIVE
jgi:hypothetical protein